jgi:hypothetical protein
MSMTRSYRANGRDHLGRAKALFADGDVHSLVYCALELRMAIEAHVYDTARSYADELPEKKLSKWQPAQLLRELLEIDPHAAVTGTLSFAREPGDAEPKEWVTIGTQKRMSLKEVGETYNHLGKYLHLETVLDHADGKVRNMGRLRSLCGKVIERVDDLYSTTLFGLKLGNTSQMECFVCSKVIKRRTSNLKEGDSVVTQCGNDCFATYTMELVSNQIRWTARFDEVPCQHKGCDGTVQIWERHQKAGNSFLCDKCRRGSEIILSLRPESTSNE